MRGYVITTGTIFGLVTIAHLWRMSVERDLATAPWYLLITATAGVLTFWAARLVWLGNRR
ncbi:MAG: hypothetical protein ABI679_06855 [Gemmatimonadota bacterium]